MDKKDKISLWKKITFLFATGTMLVLIPVVCILLNLLSHRGFSLVTLGIWLVFVLVGVILIIMGWMLQRKHGFVWWEKMT
jgi:lipopolysaccharide export LptBFGC system permease protein LptF